VGTPPEVKGAICSHCHGIIFPTINLNNFFLFWKLHEDGYAGEAVCNSLYAQLSLVVASPGPNLGIPGEGKAMIPPKSKIY
jgi:hypothetical protein